MVTLLNQQVETKVSRTAHAKLNLFLHIVGRRADGYHELESLFAFTKGGDTVSAELSQDISLNLDGPFAPALNASGSNNENLVLKAAFSLKQHAGYGAGANIKLTKNLPIASGVGGGSADAAATLLVLNQLWGLNVPLDVLEKIALSLGADVPACLYSSPQKVKGIGEELGETSLPRGYGVLLVNPGQSVATPAVFKAFHGVGEGFRDLLQKWAPKGEANFINWLRDETSNDLAVPAVGLCPGINDVLAALRACKGTLVVRMSGSGATCFALFEAVENAEQAQVQLARAHPAWWISADQLIPS